MNPLVCFAAIAVILIGANDVSGAGSTQLVIAPRSSLILSGSSNVTGWRCTGTTLEGRMDVAAPVEKVNEVIDRIEDGNIGPWMSNPAAGRFPQPRFDLTIPITSLRCTGGRPMEKDMTRALKADRVPTITFRFAGLRSGITHHIDDRQFEATIAGQLSLAGVTREISFPVTARRLSRSQFRLTADMPVRMTDFGVAPPTALFGVVKAANELSVRLDLTLEVVR
jgi:hypothetical protein